MSAALAAAGVTIDLGLQSDGFTITGSAQGDTITGSSAADTSIDAGGWGRDTIVGRVRPIVGYDRSTRWTAAETDTLTLAATSADLNAAADDKLTSVEIVSAALAAAAVTIDLGLQSDGFTITGSAHGDTITGRRGRSIKRPARRSPTAGGVRCGARHHRRLRRRRTRSTAGRRPTR